MRPNAGRNKRDLKELNQRLVLELVATQPGLSRVDMARMTGLTKMTIGNIVGELIERDLLEEAADLIADTANGAGRTPIKLRVSRKSPCVLGVSIKRGLLQVVLADLAGVVLEKWSHAHDDPITAAELVRAVEAGVDAVLARAARPVAGVGVASLGPVDSAAGTILNPANFWGIQNVPIADILRQRTGLPVFVINDGNSGALAEKVFGKGRTMPNYLFLHVISYGIGAGLVLEDKLYSGVQGQSGEIGHMTINFAGPKCACGNTGCLELYANVTALRGYIRDLSELLPGSLLAGRASLTLVDVIDAAAGGDGLAVTALDWFCEYLSHAVANVVILLDIPVVVVDYPGTDPGDVLGGMLRRRVSRFIHRQQHKTLRVIRSEYGGAAPLMGAVALIADKVFRGELAL